MCGRTEKQVDSHTETLKEYPTGRVQNATYRNMLTRVSSICQYIYGDRNEGTGRFVCTRTGLDFPFEEPEPGPLERATCQLSCLRT